MAHEKEVLVRAKDLSVAYGRRTVLRAVSLEVREGQFWFLLGPNGHGKTTLLRCVLGLTKPRSGELWLSPTLRGNQDLGFVPQRCEFNATLPTTVEEFVLMGIVGIRCARRERRDRLASALGHVGLGDKAHESYWRLSGGQRQRALVARALVRRPRVLILDEPTNGLDLATEESLLGLLSDLNARAGLTILFVSHDLSIASRYGSHFALFRDGAVTAGLRADVFTSATLAQTFGVSVDACGGRVASGPEQPRRRYE